ncbi:hypothetical protein VNI00_004787 [Paramarasmius palmivorus]|uniref:Uncharacterized protein n=1 Tax=Paramarasmius palmivorus TaxID=297713 RepID=A0AAW0DK63_9AGAR
MAAADKKTAISQLLNPQGAQHRHVQSSSATTRANNIGQYSYHHHHHPPPSYSGNIWQQQQQQQQQQYPAYSHANQPSFYQDPSFMTPSVHQSSERASIRLLAQKTAMPPEGYSGFSNSGGGGVSRDPQLYQQIPYQLQQHHPEENGHAQVPRKRSVSSVTDEGYDSSSKKQKKMGSEGSGSNSTRPPNSSGSKRGFHTKKRNETANIVAQAAQGNITPSAVSYIVPNTNGKGKGSTPVEFNRNLGGQTCQTEVQIARCMSHKYKDKPFPRCVSCTRRWAGDTCRFQGIRMFMKDDEQNVVGFGFAKHQKAEVPSMQFPTTWNLNLGWDEIKRTKVGLVFIS